MDTLTNLAVEYGTDKWSNKHHYTPVYHEMFKDRRNEVLNVLEIGVAEGAGVRMFRDYFPNAMIYGIDNDKKRLLVEDRIQTYYGDQSDTSTFYDFLMTVGGDFDLIVDDGSHIPSHQVETCKALYSILNKNGIYIIEDVADKEIVKLLPEFKNIEIKQVGRRYDDCLIICQK